MMRDFTLIEVISKLLTRKMDFLTEEGTNLTVRVLNQEMALIGDSLDNTGVFLACLLVANLATYTQEVFFVVG